MNLPFSPERAGKLNRVFLSFCTLALLYVAYKLHEYEQANSMLTPAQIDAGTDKIAKESGIPRVY